MKMDNLRQRREHLQSAELRLKRTILEHDKSIVVGYVLMNTQTHVNCNDIINTDIKHVF